MPEKLPIRILGNVPITVMSRVQFAAEMISNYQKNKTCENQPPLISFSANGEMLSMCGRDPEYLELIQQADIVDADGQSLVIFSKLWPGMPLPERVATTDFFHDAAKAAEENGLSFYFLGGAEDVLQSAVKNVQNLYPKLKFSGARNGYFSDAEKDTIILEIAKAKPDILWVGMGSPRQQEFSLYAREKLTGVTWIKTCGGLFDFLAGNNSRAPQWMQDAGLEWVYRLALEPKRLFWRYALTNPHAIYLMLTKSPFPSEK